VTARPSADLSPVVATSPLRNPRFRVFYIGSVGVALGYTMQATVAAWLMATMTPSALMVALVQTASTAPTLVFGLFAGALADIIERRKVILATQVILFATTIVLGLATVAGLIVPWMLLALTFVIGAGFTVYMPAQQASINDLVSRAELPRAVALGAVAFNVARAVGPALAGALVAWIGSGSTLLASAAFFIAMIVVVRGWRPQEAALPGVPETLVSGILSGLRYARHSAPMRAIIVRNLCFSVCASALWALLPVVARDQLGLGAGGFGLLFGSFGAGAVAGALSIPRHLQKYSLTRVVTAATLFWVMATTLIAATHLTIVAVIGTCLAGAAWVGVLASLSAGTQSAAPAWVRARAVAMNLLAVQASLALGSIVWGAIASYWDTRVALLAAAIAMMVLLFANRRVRVRMGVEAEVTPGAQLPDLHIPTEPQPDDGPVLIQIEYRVDAGNREAFLQAIRRIGPTRRRNGASSWRVFRDVGEDGRFVERYILDSWAEYVRLRARMTVSDRKLQEEVFQYQRAGVPIGVSRLLGVDLPEGAGAVPAKDAPSSD
jgi:MFS family permease